MKILLKTFSGILALAILIVAGFMATVSILHARSRQQIAELVSEIRPGMSFTNVTSRLGPESQRLTDVSDIASYGTTKEARFVTNSILHLFIHEAIPSRWICVYTDPDSQAVLDASWRDM